MLCADTDIINIKSSFGRNDGFDDRIAPMIKLSFAPTSTRRRLCPTQRKACSATYARSDVA